MKKLNETKLTNTGIDKISKAGSIFVKATWMYYIAYFGYMFYLIYCFIRYREKKQQ